jgi:hypothetical protein
MRAQPGKYTISITCGSVTESVTGTVLEQWRWPVLNYNTRGGLGISER